MGVGLGVTSLLSVLLAAIVMMQCRSKRYFYSQYPSNLSGTNVIRRFKPEENVQQAETNGVLNPEAQLYEEIREPQNVAETVATREAASATTPQYEDVKPVKNTSNSSDSYQITLCSAYGISELQN